MDRVAGWGRRHWFYLLVPIWVISTFGFRATHPWSRQPGWGEAVILFDWCVFVPALYLLCYRDHPPRALALRALALMCGGIWIAGQVVPDPARTMLDELGWARGIGLAIVILFEGAAMLAMLRIAFGKAPDPAELERQGIPPLLVKAILAEARFWRWLWSKVRGR